MQLIDDLIIDRNSRPVRILPWKSAGIDNLRGAVNTLRLKARGRVGKRPVSVETIGIPAANSSLFDKGGEMSANFVRQQTDYWFQKQGDLRDEYLAGKGAADPEL